MTSDPCRSPSPAGGCVRSIPAVKGTGAGRQRLEPGLVAIVLGLLAILEASSPAAAPAQQPVPPAESPARQADVPPLKDVFEDAFLIGGALDYPRRLREGVPMEAALAARHFSALTAENSMKPISVQPVEGRFHFADADRLVELAESSGAAPIGHCLVWHSQTPRWFFEGPDGRPAGRELALTRLREHIAAVVGRYKGRVKQWDVVNEAISDAPGQFLRQTPWLAAIGDDYIAEAFRAAHEADPDAILIYNDYGIELRAKRRKALQLLQSLLDEGVPIHAVGIQCHWRMDHPGFEEVEESIRQFAALGLKVMITELDIGVLPTRYRGADIARMEDPAAKERSAMNPYTEGLPDAVARQHADRYRQAFAMFLRHRDSIGRVTFWGTYDGRSWLNNFPIRGRTDYPLLFDRQGQPKPAFFAVVELASDRAARPAAEERRVPLSALNIYRGETHAHSVYTWSHGGHRVDNSGPLKDDWDQEHYTNYQGPPDRHFERAKAKGFDFYAVTDHSQEKPFQPVDPRENRAWLDTLAAAERHTDETFVAMAGFEYSRNPPFDNDNTGTGHLNALNVAEYVNAEHVSIPEFYDWLKRAAPAGGTGCVVASFNHPGRTQFHDWAYLDAEIVELVALFELRTVYRGPPRWDAYVRALNRGWKVSPISVTDSHGYWHLENIPPLTHILAPELTKEALTRAMRQRRTYTSWAGGRDTRVDLKYSVNEHVMGSTLDKPTVLRFRVEMETPPDDLGQRVRRIQILRNHPTELDRVEVAAEALFDGDQHTIVWTTTIEDAASRYFLPRIHHNNDMTGGVFHEHGSTYAAPVWTGR